MTRGRCSAIPGESGENTLDEANAREEEKIEKERF